MSGQDPLRDLPLSSAVTSRFVPDVNGLNMHVLEAKGGSKGDSSESPRPLLLLLHGFPELAYSYRKLIEPLSNIGAGYHVVAPDQRGYGRTTGWNSKDLDSFRMLNLVTDIIALVQALGYRTVHCIVGHDFGSPVAAYCSLIRPEVFHSVVLMSAPFPGAPSFPPRTERDNALRIPNLVKLAKDLLDLDPPRRAYQQYYAPPSTEANNDMMHAKQGLPAFLRAYYHMKSADFSSTTPHPLTSWSADEFSKLPEYYMMRADKTMSETVYPHLPADSSHSPWLTDEELSIYVTEFERTSFQGGLNWYQFTTSPQLELRVFAGKRIQVPALFIAGEKDWGMYQVPGALEVMRAVVCEKMAPGETGCVVVKGAGHWVQQEQPDQVVRIITQFLHGISEDASNNV